MAFHHLQRKSRLDRMSKTLHRKARISGFYIDIWRKIIPHFGG
ncbi:hypothetical protein [Moraxella lacunata]